MKVKLITAWTWEDKRDWLPGKRKRDWSESERVSVQDLPCFEEIGPFVCVDPPCETLEKISPHVGNPRSNNSEEAGARKKNVVTFGQGAPSSSKEKNGRSDEKYF